jgi:acyl dehydratase
LVLASEAILAPIEPLSFDDLPLGGEWTTRRRTISDSEIALFAGISGDFSPLSIESGHGQPRLAPPTLIVAVAVGLGTIDMPVPQVEEWEWLNWKFPRPIHAGDTVYARWTLTQKRPPVGAAPTSIVVWRVDVHTSDGALCAEGEVGAKVRRQAAARTRERSAEPAATSTAVAAAPRRRRRRRPAGANGPVPETPAVAAAPPAPAVKQERASGAPRRRRRRRPASSTAGREGETAATPASNPEPPPAAAPASSGSAGSGGGLGRVIRRLRRT